MAITKLNSQAIPPNTIVESDLSYPLANFSSTGIDDNATSTAITIDSSENIGINESSPDELLHVKGPDEATIKIEATGSQFPTLYDGTPRLMLVPMATNGFTGEAIIEASSPSSLLHSTGMWFRAAKSQNQLGDSYVGGSFTFHDGNQIVCNISDQGIEAANFQATSGGTTALSLSATGRVTTGENLEVAGDLSASSLTLEGTLDPILTLDSSDDGPVYIDFKRLGDRHCYVGFGSSNDDFFISNDESTGAIKFDVAGSNTMTISDLARVGIGTTSPAAKLDVRGAAHTSGIRVKRGDTSGISNPNDDFMDLYLTDNDANFVINNDADGDVGNYRFFKKAAGVDVELARIASNGTFHADGNVVAYSTTISDERLKDDVQPITNALDTVDALRGVTYTWNAGSREGKRDYGVIAQEVEQVIPEIVHDTTMPLLGDEETIYKTVDYEKLCAVLINAVSELRAEVEELRASRN
jgi:hypothetical protein